MSFNGPSGIPGSSSRLTTEMPRKTHLAIVWTLLLAFCVLTAGAVDAPSSGSAQSSQTVVDLAAGGHDAPVKMSAGMADPEAFHPEAPRRLDAPERELAELGTLPAPVRPVRDLRDRDVAADRLCGSSPAPALHLRLCVFLC